jgi:hypothetical protein
LTGCQSHASVISGKGRQLHAHLIYLLEKLLQSIQFTMIVTVRNDDDGLLPPFVFTEIGDPLRQSGICIIRNIQEDISAYGFVAQSMRQMIANRFSRGYAIYKV